MADTFDCKAFAQVAWWKAVCLQTLQHRLTAVPLRQFSDSVLVSVHWWAHIVCKASLYNSPVDLISCVLVIFLYKSDIAEQLCHCHPAAPMSEFVSNLVVNMNFCLMWISMTYLRFVLIYHSKWCIITNRLHAITILTFLLWFYCLLDATSSLWKWHRAARGCRISPCTWSNYFKDKKMTMFHDSFVLIPPVFPGVTVGWKTTESC